MGVYKPVGLYSHHLVCGIYWIKVGRGVRLCFFALAGIGHDTLVFYQGWAEQCCRIAGGLLISDKENVFQGWYYPSDKIIHRAYYPPVYAGGFDNHRGVVRILPYDLLDSNSYYLLCALVLLIGMGWLTSALMVFVRDIKQTIEVFNTLFFWLTPIIWPHEGLTDQSGCWLISIRFLHYQWLSRDLYTWQMVFRTGQPHYLLLVRCHFLFVVGAIVFQKLKPHYADVL